MPNQILRLCAGEAQVERENASVFKERVRYERVRLHNISQLESSIVSVKFLRFGCIEHEKK